MRRRLSAIGTVLVALAGLLAAPLAGPQLPLLAIATGLAVGVGAEAHARLHPRFGPPAGRRFAGFGIGPALTALAAALVAGRMEAAFQLLAPAVGALLVGVLLFAQDRELDDYGQDRWTPLAFALVQYLVAFVLFVAFYTTRDAIWLTALGVGTVGTLLSGSLYRPTGATLGRAWLLAGVTGLCLAELTLALNVWIVPGLLGGACLLLFFYVAAGLVQALLDGSLTARLAVEYSLVGLVGLALILSTSPWRP